MPVSVSVGFADESNTADAFARAAADAAAGLDGPCTLCVIFVGAPHLGAPDAVLGPVHAALSPESLIGCGAAGVIAASSELEGGAGAVVWALSARDAEVLPLELSTLSTPDGVAIEGLSDDPDDLGDSMILLADPNSFSPEPLLAYLADVRPGMPVLGGLASAARPGSASLFLNDTVVDQGAVACSFRGVEVLPCVSQGAVPVGPEMTVTRAEGNVVAELASKPALERLREVIEDLDEAERRLAGQGLLVGIVIDENQPEYGRGDFLVRPIMGADPESGAVAVADRMRVGQTVRLHVRDASSASDDLREALETRSLALGDAGAAGALVFSCNGRGSHMFDEPGHDAGLLAEILGAPAGGLFAAGEIGPVGGRNFLHGFTATMAVFPND